MGAKSNRNGTLDEPQSRYDSVAITESVPKLLGP